MDAAALAWSPIVGLLAAILTVSFYIPLAAFYVPPDVAIILALVAISWIRGFKAEIDFCDLCPDQTSRRFLVAGIRHHRPRPCEAFERCERIVRFARTSANVCPYLPFRASDIPPRR